MNCPDCHARMTKTAGGNVAANGDRSGYRVCRNEDCDSYGRRAKMFKAKHGDEVFVHWMDEVESRLSKREALRILRQQMRDDRAWFDGVTDETQDFARQVVRYFYGRLS